MFVFFNFIIFFLLCILYLSVLHLLYKIIIIIVLLVSLVFFNIAPCSLFSKLCIFLFFTFISFISLNIYVSTLCVSSYVLLLCNLFSSIVCIYICIYSYDFYINYEHHFIYVLFILICVYPLLNFIHVYYFFLPSIDFTSIIVLKCIVVVFSIFSVTILFLFFIFICVRILAAGDIIGSIIHGYNYCKLAYSDKPLVGLYGVIGKNMIYILYTYVYLLSTCSTFIVVLKYTIKYSEFNLYELLLGHNFVLLYIGDFTTHITVSTFIVIFMSFEFIMFIILIRFVLVFMQIHKFWLYLLFENMINRVFLNYVLDSPDKLYRSFYIDILIFVIRIAYLLYLRDLIPYIAFVGMFVVISLNLYYNLSNLSDRDGGDRLKYKVFIFLTVILVVVSIVILFL